MQNEHEINGVAEIEAGSTANRQWPTQRIVVVTFAVVAATLLTLWDASQFKDQQGDDPFWGGSEQARYATFHVPAVFLKNALSIYWATRALLCFGGVSRILLGWGFIVPALAWPMVFGASMLLPKFAAFLFLIPATSGFVVLQLVRRHFGIHDPKLLRQASLGLAFNVCWWVWAFLNFVYAQMVRGD